MRRHSLRPHHLLILGATLGALTLAGCFPSQQAAPSYQDFEMKTKGYGYANEYYGPEYYEEPLFEEYPYSGPTFDTVTVLDPVAGAFTVDVPLGWDSTVFSSGMFSDHRQTVISMSPDGLTVLFSGDPSLPYYWSPSHPNNQYETSQIMVDSLENAEWREYEYADTWVEWWIYDKFGNLDGFVYYGSEFDPQEEQNMYETYARELGISIDVSVARGYFGYETEYGPMTGLVVGSTSNMDSVWYATVRGLSTIGDPLEYEPMLTAMVESETTTPEWKSQQDQYWAQVQAQNQAFTEQMISTHNSNMAWIQNSSAAHQARMENIWAANDASMNNFYNRMASMDSNQRSFLNYLQDENTVQIAGGETYQVPQGVDVYYVNPSTGATVGGNSAFGEQDLYQMGLNPSDWTRADVIQ